MFKAEDLIKDSDDNEPTEKDQDKILKEVENKIEPETPQGESERGLS